MSALTDPPRRALVIKLGHIGDVLVSTPVFSALAQAYPGIRLTALVNQGTQDMVLNNPEIAQVLVLERGHASRLKAWRHQLGLLRGLRAGRFDLAIDLSGGDRGAFLAWASGARLRVGFAPKRPAFRARAFHLLADRRGTQNHEVMTMLRTVEQLGIAPQPWPLRLLPDPQAQARAARIMAEHDLTPKTFALVHPTSRWMFKSWTPQGNAQVMAHLARRGLKLVMTCAPAPQEAALAEGIMAELARLEPGHKVVNLAGQLDLPSLGALIAQARVFFGVDSAPMHMAAALGVPTVVLFGPSGEKMWGPWQVAHEVVTRPEPCRPCGRDGCDGSKISRCLVEMDPAQVCAALDRLLDRTE